MITDSEEENNHNTKTNEAAITLSRQRWPKTLIIRIFGKNGIQASLNTVAIWIRLLELPIEYYEAPILARIGKKVGKLLKVDNATTLEKKGPIRATLGPS
ncbi:hypothetical protein GOBAR_DD36706 [Gossypium barbadense]|nr:hypothetical protein GOBAR_DD36706 [Gossypium barbadense]